MESVRMMPIRIVTEEEWRRTNEEFTRRHETNQWSEIIYLPLRNDEQFLNGDNRVQVFYGDRTECDYRRHLTVRFDERRFERTLRLPRTIIPRDIQCVMNPRGWLMINALVEREFFREPEYLREREYLREPEHLREIERERELEREHRELSLFNLNRRYETRVGNKVFYNRVESEEYRMIRKYLKKLERLVLPNTLRARIVKCEETQGTKIELNLDCHRYRKEDITVTVKENESKIIIDAHNETKDNMCNTLDQFRREFMQWPTKIVDLKKVRTTITQERRLVIEIPTLVDLLPHFRLVEENLEVKRS